MYGQPLDIDVTVRHARSAGTDADPKSRSRSDIWGRSGASELKSARHPAPAAPRNGQSSRRRPRQSPNGRHL